jgi:hypothetical protein
MLMMRDGHAEMQVPAGANGAFQNVTVEFPGEVLSATPVLRGFMVKYGDLEHVASQDHHLAQLAAALEIASWGPPGIQGQHVTVSCVLNLMDDNGDDPMAGTIDFTVIADVQVLVPPIEPPVNVGRVT